MQRLAILDLFRFLAAFYVMLYHYGHRGAFEYTQFSVPSLEPFLKYGYLGVEFFFVISGYVIVISARSCSWHRFLVRRYLRLTPSLCVAAIITYCVLNLAGGSGQPPIPTASLVCNLIALPFCSLAGLPNVDGVYWSLVVEWFFYFFVACALALKVLEQEKVLLFLLYAWIGLSSISLLGYFDQGILLFLKRALLLNYSGLFTCGICFAAFTTVTLGSPNMKRYWCILILLAIVVSLFHVAEDALELSQSRGVFYSPIVASGIVALFIASVLLATIGVVELKGPFTPIALKLGLLSYPLYLLHQNIGYTLINILHHYYESASLILSAAIIAILGLSQILVLTSERVSSMQLKNWASDRSRKEGENDKALI